MAARKKRNATRRRVDDAADELAAPRTLAELPPWLGDTASALRQREASGRLPHALLLRGPEGIGKRPFARWFAEALLCRSATPAGACGRCPSCAQLLARAHPDYRELAPDGAGIKIDAVRETLAWQQLATPRGGWRIALFDGADTLNRNAANALLKTLEEPADGALLLLVADRAARLPATVRSRCQDIVLRVERERAAFDWLLARSSATDEAGARAALARAGGAPFRALALESPAAREALARLHQAWTDLLLHRGSVGRISDSVADLPLRQCLEIFDRLIAATLRARAGLPPGPDPAEQRVVSQVADRLEDEQWFAIRDTVQRLHRIDGPSFKTQAVLDGLLADIRLVQTAHRQPTDTQAIA